MARDYTKYSVAGVGENLNKRKLVAAVVADYVSKNNPTFQELQEAFPDSVQGNKGFIRRADDIQDEKRFDTKNPLLCKYKVEACVSNQWGSKNIDAFISHAEQMGYSIEASQSEQGQEATATAELPEDHVDARKMPLPEHLRPDWDLNWGSYASINLQNSPDLETDNFSIMLSLGTHQILGAPKAWERHGDYRWFQDDALLYSYNLEDYQSSCSIWLYDANFEETCNALMHGCLEDIDYGELPDGLTEDRFNEIFNGVWFSALYHHIKRNLNHPGLDD